jgi:hypothetical protein
MSDAFHRISAIIRTDILFRFRRTAALVTLLLVAAGVYLIVPDIKGGMTLMQIKGHRVLYNSATVALGTGMFCSIFLSLVGFYVVSNSFRRDIASRVAFILAATRVTNTEYIAGKFCGNVLYLASLMLACMLSAMVMFLIRGEGALQPEVFLVTYLWLTIPPIAFCSAAALTFESVPGLSGRIGDVVFFIVLVTALGVTAPASETNPHGAFLNAFDVVGVLPVLAQLKEQFHTQSWSIGSSPFDASLQPIVFPGISWGSQAIISRLLALIFPVTLLVVARLAFHRFNPTRIKSFSSHARRSILARINAMLKPVTGSLQPLLLGAQKGQSRTTFLDAVRVDVFMTLVLSPLTIVALIVFAVLSLSLGVTSIQQALLPAIIVTLVIVLADIVPRDASSRMTSLLFTAPHLKTHYVWWKFAATLSLTFAFTLLPLVRLLLNGLPAAISLFVGSCFIAASAVGLGVLSHSQKPFIATFLLLLYISLNAASSPVLDFAGFHNSASGAVQLGYAVLALGLIVIAHVRHQALIRRQ